MPNDGQWVFSGSDEYFNNGEYFDSKDEAIISGKECYDEYNHKFYVGQVKNVGLGVCVDVDSIFEHINQNMYDEVGECGEDYLYHTKPEHNDELENDLINVITNWIQKHKYQPTFFKVINIETVEF